MKDFLKDNISVFVKLNLYQFGSAFVGILLALVAGTTGNKWLMIAASLFAICFHFFIVYTYMWDLGAREKIRVDSHRADYKPIKGFYYGLVANIPNIILGVLIAVFGAMKSVEWAQNIAAVSKGIALVWESMYLGIIQQTIPTSVFAFLLTPIPQIAMIFLAYFFGLNDITIIKRKSDK